MFNIQRVLDQTGRMVQTSRNGWIAKRQWTSRLRSQLKATSLPSYWRLQGCEWPYFTTIPSKLIGPSSRKQPDMRTWGERLQTQQIKWASQLDDLTDAYLVWQYHPVIHADVGAAFNVEYIDIYGMFLASCTLYVTHVSNRLLVCENFHPWPKTQELGHYVTGPWLLIRHAQCYHIGYISAYT